LSRRSSQHPRLRPAREGGSLTRRWITRRIGRCRRSTGSDRAASDPRP
jgi:hypothetical protein